ncbi:MAG: hypothetical protein PHH98_03710 [Candidatus Gracilibacteria bacterium]|nr:hypothetical protein [Candidatus Gracilibacteria bacterium]
MNILLFGLGNQGVKYVKNFNNDVFCVTKSGINKTGIEVKNIISYSNFIDNYYSFDFLNNFDLIIICVDKSSLDNLINKLCFLNLHSKILIDKPVSYDLDLLEKLKNYNNIYYFIDEIFFNKLYNKIFNSSYVKIISIKNVDVLEHVFGGFLLNNNFDLILKNINIIYEDEKNRGAFNLNFKIVNKNYILYYNNGIIFLNGKKINHFSSFEKVIDIILNFDENDNIRYKNNFILMRQKLNNL